MNPEPSIRYLAHRHIDKQKWDDCINKARNGLIYAYSFYLDHMATNWDALVLGEDDYEAVMPLPWRSKYGISYLYPPFLTAQLGLFGNNISAGLLESFMKAVPSKFRYWDLYLNHGNVHSLQQFQLYQRKNYILDLHQPYEKLYNGYRENIQRNIRKAEQAGCRPLKDFEVDKVIKLAVAQMRNYSKESAANTTRFQKLYQYLHDQDRAVTYGIQSSRHELLASCVFLFSHNRAYYLLVGNHADGRTIGASHALIDRFINDHAGKKMVLDFEGSDIRNLAFFYSSFGAVEENYPGIRLNRLPFYLKWVKQ